MAMNRRDDGDQSQFAAEELLFESTRPVETAVETTELTEVQRVAKRKQRMLLLGSIGFGAVLLLVVVLSALTPAGVADPENTPLLATPAVAEKTVLQLRIDDLRTDFRQADPSKQPLLFPPLNYQLGITTND